MTRRLAMTAALLAATAASAQAGTLTTSLAAFTAGVGGAINHDTSVGVADNTSVFAVSLAGGAVIGFSQPVLKDSLSDPSNSLPPFADGYTGDVYTPSLPSTTVTLPGGALGFDVFSLSTNFLGTASYTIFVSSSDGQTITAQVPTYDPFGSGYVGQFVGYIGGPASITVSTTDPQGLFIAEIVDAPEPATLAVLAAGLLGLVLTRRARV